MEWRQLSKHGTRHMATLAAACALFFSVVLMWLPTNVSDLFRNGVGWLLRPGVAVGASLRQNARHALGSLRALAVSAEETQALQEEVRELQRTCDALRAAAAACPQNASAAGGQNGDVPPLLAPSLVRAQVLGRQARGFLAERHLLAIPPNANSRRDDLVLDLPAIIDCGEDGRIEAGSLLVHGRLVWGKIDKVAACTSSVRTVASAGFRDLVELASSDRAAAAHAPQGILEGVGEPLARIRMIPVTDPVAEGDWVLAVSAKGVVRTPLVYGRITRVARPVASQHWDIWMEPAVRDEPVEVAVLSVSLARPVSPTAAERNAP